MKQKKLELDARLFESIGTRDLIKFTAKLAWSRFCISTKHKLADIKHEVLTKPFGRVFVQFHLLRDKAFEFAYEKGWISKKLDSFEIEFDRKTHTCYNNIFLKELLKHCEENYNGGNTTFYSVQNSRPCFTALGAWSHKEWISKHEFDISSYPFSNSFTGRSIPVHVMQNNMSDYQKFVRKLFLESMDIDEHYTVKNDQAFYSKGLLNLYHLFACAPMFQNEQMDFWMGRFVKSYMRLVYLEQRKLDVNLKHIHDLRERWEQEVVDDFMLGVTLLGVTHYASVFKSLPFRIQKRVPNFHARNSYEKKGIYRPPVQAFANRKEV